MGWVNNYMQLLNDKDWSETISQVTITDPVSIFSIFSVSSGTILLENNVEDNIETNIDVETTETIIVDVETWNNQEITNTWEALDPYDPEFEEDFNSFFWWETTETWELFTGSLEEEKETTEHTVWEALIKKFNE